MAAKKKKPAAPPRVSPPPPAAAAAPAPAPAPTPPAPAPGRRRDLRPWIFAGFDLGFAAIYAFLLSTVAVNRLWWAQLLLWSLVGCVAVMGLAMIYRKRWAWLAAVIAGGLMLLVTLIILILILISAGFLAGVYGAFGRAASSFSLIAAALIIEAVALLPVFEMKYLMTRAGRRAFDLPPLWKPR